MQTHELTDWLFYSIQFNNLNLKFQYKNWKLNDCSDTNPSFNDWQLTSRAWKGMLYDLLLTRGKREPIPYFVKESKCADENTDDQQ